MLWVHSIGSFKKKSDQTGDFQRPISASQASKKVGPNLPFSFSHA